MYIDCHVHCRDEEQAYKDTIANCLRIASLTGLDAIFDMPNTARPVTSRKRVLERFELAKAADLDVFYGAYIGLTPNREQIKEAVETHREFFPLDSSKYGVIGMKMFAGQSTGNLGILDPQQQEFVYAQLTNFGYNGVLAVHCERQDLMKPELFNPKQPWTHCLARPKQAEIEAVRDQLKFVKSTKYMGHLHICHVSCPESVDLVQDEGARRFRLSTGVTPHHLLLNVTSMESDNGILYKMNPPLRTQEDMRELFEQLLDGRIDILESDHAQHTLEEKTGQVSDAQGKPMYASGIPNLQFRQITTRVLLSLGVHQGLLNKMTFNDVNEIFRTKIKNLHKETTQVDSGFFNPYAHFGK